MMNDIEREYLNKLLTSETLCAVDYKCNITDKTEPLLCDSCKYAEYCNSEKYNLGKLVKKGVEKILQDEKA